EAGHPIPDAAGLAAAERALEYADAADTDDLVLVLMSGGASANWIAPAAGITFADKQAVTRALLKCGAHIGEINAVRKHLSRIKAGRLARHAFPARVATIAISDVPGDDPAVIGSGPTVPDPSTLEEARAILAKYALDVPVAVTLALADPANETPKPGDKIFASTRFTLAARPAVIMSGGELTVTIRGQGRGGPNQEYALALAIELAGMPGIAAIAGDTDGTDGGAGSATDPAGAYIDSTTVTRAKSLGLDPAAFLADNDSTGFFMRLGDLLQPGPTYTNVNDFRAIVVDTP